MLERTRVECLVDALGVCFGFTLIPKRVHVFVLLLLSKAFKGVFALTQKHCVATVSKIESAHVHGRSWERPLSGVNKCVTVSICESGPGPDDVESHSPTVLEVSVAA